jgi:hypothetical protein
MKPSITIQETIDFLNSLLEVDREAISLLMAERTPCSLDLTNHPTVQCGDMTVAPMGIINGMFGVYEDGPKKNWGAICRVVGEDGITIERFELIPNEKSPR